MEFSQVRYERARELEAQTGLKHHTWIHLADDKQGRWGGMFRIKRARQVVSVFLLLAWSVLLFRPISLLAALPVALAVGLYLTDRRFHRTLLQNLDAKESKGGDKGPSPEE